MVSRWTALVVALSAGAALADPAGERSPDSATPPALVVRASGFTHGRGHAIAKLHRRGEDLRLPVSFRRVKAAIQDRRATLVFPDVPDGSYAVILFHDENDNADLDHNWLGFPREPLGFSNRFRVGLFSGMPTFDKLRFEVDRGRTGRTTTLDIEVR